METQTCQKNKQISFHPRFCYSDISIFFNAKSIQSDMSSLRVLPVSFDISSSLLIISSGNLADTTDVLPKAGRRGCTTNLLSILSPCSYATPHNVVLIHYKGLQM